MIIQIVLNWWCEVIAAFMLFIPPLPPSWASALTGISDGGAWLASRVSKFGGVLPFTQLGIIVQAWLGLLGMWFSVLVARVLLRAVGR